MTNGVHDSPDVLAPRLRTAFDLYELGESIRRAQLRREHPDATDEETETMLVAWLQTRPGAPSTAMLGPSDLLTAAWHEFRG